MKKLFSLPIVVLLMVFTAAAQEAPTKFSGRVRGESYEYKYTDADFANSPSWKPEDGTEPPVSVARAVAIAKQNLTRFVDQAALMKPRSMVLQNVGGDKWAWRIFFTCFGAQCKNSETRSFMIYVKMDESILEPKRVVVEP